MSARTRSCARSLRVLHRAPDGSAEDTSIFDDHNAADETLDVDDGSGLRDLVREATEYIDDVLTVRGALHGRLRGLR